MSVQDPPAQLELDQSQFTLLHAQDTLAPLKALHRGDNGVIGFTRKGANGRWENLFSLQIAELEAMFPALAKWLIQDAYFTVNGMYRAAPYCSRLTGQPDVWRCEKHLRYLNACYVDLDCGRDSGTEAQCLTWRAAMARFGDLMDAKVIPQCSIFARSGRGLYVFWLLKDEGDADQPPRYWPESGALYKAINRAINGRLSELAADGGAIDAARVLRVPGTKHSVTQQAATYMIQLDADGQPYSYTLAELADFFNLPNIHSSLPSATREMANGVERSEEVEGQDQPETAGTTYGRKTKNPGTAPNRAKGWYVRHARRAQDLVTLERWHEGWKKGQRRRHLDLYANFLHGAGVRREAVLNAVRIMAANCHPAYPSDSNDMSLESLVARAFRCQVKIPNNQKLCQWLGVTTELARDLRLCTILPEAVRQERQAPPGGNRELQRRERRDFIRAYIEAHGAPSSRVMLAVLKGAGFHSNRQTVNDDLNALGAVSTATPQRGAGRPKHQADAQADAQVGLPLEP